MATDRFPPLEDFLGPCQCSILTCQSKGFIHSYAPTAHPHKFPPYTILLSCLTSKSFFFFNIPSQYQSTPSTVDLLSNNLFTTSYTLIIPHSLHIAESLENIIIDPFIHPFCYSTQLLLLLPYHCLTKNRGKQCIMRKFCTLKQNFINQLGTQNVGERKW